MTDIEAPRMRYRIPATLVVLAFAGLWLFEGYYVLTAWFPSLYDDLTPINGVAAGAFMTLMLVCALLVWVAPRKTVGAFRVLFVGALFLTILLPMAFLLSEPFVAFALYLVGFGVLGAVYLTHPAKSHLRPSLEPNRSLLIWSLLLSIPFVMIAAVMLYNQLTLDDAIAERWFYGGYSLYLLTIAAYAIIASIHRETRLLFAITACTLALVLGLVSITYPGEINSLGYLGGGMVVLWAGGFVLLTRWNYSLGVHETAGNTDIKERL